MTDPAEVGPDLRAPLAVIMGYLDLLQNRHRLTLTEEKQDECLEVVERNCHELLHLIERLVFTEAIEPGDLAVHRQGVELGELVGRCFGTWTAQAAAQGVELILVKGPPISGSIDVSVGHVTVTRPGRGGHNPPSFNIAREISA